EYTVETDQDAEEGKGLMAFVGVEFDNNDGGGISLIHKLWLTRRKKKTWWPPSKQQAIFEKFLKKDVEKSNLIKKRKVVPPKCLCLDSSEEETKEDLSPKLDGITDLVETLTQCSSSECSSQASLQAFTEVSPLLQFRLCTPSSSSPTIHSLLSRYVPSDARAASVSNTTILNYLIHFKQQNKEIKHQNNEILKFLKSKYTNAKTVSLEILHDVPVKLSIKSLHDLNQIEEYLANNDNLLALASHYSNIGGRDTSSITNAVLKELLANELKLPINMISHFPLD
ncbi:hypothetical protein ILUMI_18728, partial [Ignelater luminosus]